MLTVRIFQVILDDTEIDRVMFSGAEYDAETVRKFLITHDGANKDIRVKEIKEIKR